MKKIDTEQIPSNINPDKRPSEGYNSFLHSVTKRFVLLKGKGGYVFWTMNNRTINKDFHKILFESDDQEDIIKEWEKYHPNVW